jgi:hypothetical protein
MEINDWIGLDWWGKLMKGQLMHSTKIHHAGQLRAEKMALTRIYKRVSYIPLEDKAIRLISP